LLGIRRSRCATSGACGASQSAIDPGFMRSGSANTTSKATAIAPASVMPVTRSATRERGQGHCPTAFRLSSSMSTIATGSCGLRSRGASVW